MAKKTDKYQALKFIPFIAIGILVYSNTLDVPFFFDDICNIRDNPTIHISNLNLAEIAKAGIRSICPTRPLANISFALNHYFHQDKLLGYHLVNIIIHVLTGIFLYLFLKITLSLPTVRSGYRNHSLIAFFAALIWMVHPIQTQSVTYIVQRMTSMASMFFLLSLLLYLKGRLAQKNQRGWPWFVGCGVAAIVSLGCKETAATLPFFIFLYEWYFFQDLGRAWIKRHVYFIIVPLILLTMLAFLYQWSLNPLTVILSDYEDRDFTMSERVLTQFRVVMFYLSLLIYPRLSRLNLDHDFQISHSFIDPITTLLSMGAIVGFLGLAVLIAKRERLISFCILWFFGNLVIESSIIGLELVFEHRNYLPSMLFFLLFIILAYKYIRRDWAIVGALSTAALLLSLGSYQRNNVWREPVTFWKDCAQKSEKKARPNYNLANALSREQNYDEAVQYYYQVIKIKENHLSALNNLGNALAAQGKFEEASEPFQRALKINPLDAMANYNLGSVLAARGQFDKSMVHFTEALRVNPKFAEVHNELGIAMAGQGNPSQADGHFAETLRINPNFFLARFNYGKFLASHGMYEVAAIHLVEAVKLQPDFAEAHNELAMVLSEQEKYEEAAAHCLEALRIKPDYAKAHYNLGSVLAKQKQAHQAMAHFFIALQLDPDFAEAHNNLGSVLAGQEEFLEAGVHFSEAIRIEPDYEMAHFNLGSVLAVQDKLDEAVFHFSEALRIKPDFVMASESLEKVRAMKSKSL